MNVSTNTPTTPSVDDRKLALANWVSIQTKESIAPEALVSLGGDAGFRRYYRFVDQRPLLAVDAPPTTEDTAQFLAVAALLRAQQVRTPQIIAANSSAGFLLVEDFGNSLFSYDLSTANSTSRYHQALDELIKIQSCPQQPSVIPAYDQALLNRELHLFPEWMLTALLQHPLTSAEHQLLNNSFELLTATALAQPQVLVHRDFHSRNLMLCNTGELGVIDFQGALWGPITYDLVSLLRDCYLRLPSDKVRELALAYRTKAIAAGYLSPLTTEAEFLTWFDWMGLQRHIKVLGIFVRLALRDNKPNYLQDLPLVLRYLIEVAERYSEFQQLADWMKTAVIPQLEAQAWYKNYTDAGE